MPRQSVAAVSAASQKAAESRDAHISAPSVVDGLDPDRKDLRPFLGLAWPIDARKKQRGLIVNFQKSDYSRGSSERRSSWHTREHRHAFRARRLANRRPPQTLSSEAVLDALKMILLGASLNEILTSVVRLIESPQRGNVVLDLPS